MKPINLNKARKAKAKADAKTKADENAVRFGRNKAERQLSQQRKTALVRHLDQHKREEP